MDRNAKIQWRDEVVEALDQSNALFLAHYSGMTVEDLTDLRRKLKAVNADFHVVKNTVAKKAVSGRKEEVVQDLFKGQTGVVFAKGDVAAVAKAVSATAKTNEAFKLIGGYMEGAQLKANQIEYLASLPSKEVLLAKIIGSMVAPHRGLVGVINAVPRSMVQVINAIKDKKAS